MKWIALGAAALALPVCAVEHTSTYNRTFPLGGGARKLVVENINGNVRVNGDAGHDVRVTVREEYRADTPELLARARNDVRVEMTQDGNTVRIFLDGPFRDRENRRRERGESYHFRHDFEVQVPREIDVTLKTINGKELKVANVRGIWELRNINGAIEATQMGGHGSAETVNGGVQASFMENPRQGCVFKSLNGAVDVAFQPDLSADLKLKTLNGDAYTDFDFAPVGGSSAAGVTQGGEGFRARISGRDKTVRVGNGGLQHQFETLNGAIKIRKYGSK